MEDTVIGEGFTASEREQVGALYWEAFRRKLRPGLARALYERQGFIPTGRGTLGLLAPVYGFDGYTTMELEVSR